MQTIKITQFGLGPIGLACLKLAAEKPWVQIVGAVDIDPAKVGQSLSALTGNPAITGSVFKSFDELYAHAKPDLVFHTAGSKADISIAQITPIVRQGVSVSSSCEELLYPRLRAPQQADQLDELCKKHNARVVATGVNPGFVMDLLPITLTGVSRSVDRIYVERVVNASTRRQPLQKKIGSGMDPDEMRRLFKEGKAGHAGFMESLHLIGHCMGWTFDQTDEIFQPMIAAYDIETPHFKVKKGHCCGIHQIVEGKVAGQQKVLMDLKMYLDAQDPHDTVKIHGDPPLDVRVQNGTAGDHATVAALVNSAPRLLKSPAGLLLSTDLPVPSWT